MKKKQIFLTLPKYIESTPIKQYRMHPSTYLNNESWNDEILTKENKYKPEVMEFYS